MVKSNDVNPHQIVDVNGRLTTVYRKDEKTGYPAGGRLNSNFVPASPATLDPTSAYAHNESFSGSRHAVPVIGMGEAIPSHEASEWHLASNAEVDTYEIYWLAKGDALDEGKSEEESTEAGDAAIDAALKATGDMAVAAAKDAVGQKYRFESGEIVTVNKIEAQARDLSGATLEIFVTNNKGDKYSFFSTNGLEGMNLLYRPTSKEGDGFSAADSSRLGSNIGRPFESSAVYDIAVLASNGEKADYPEGRYPILTGYSTKLNLDTGKSDTVFEFSSIADEKRTYTIPADKSDELEAIRFQPLRQMWNGYDPKDL